MKNAIKLSLSVLFVTMLFGFIAHKNTNAQYYPQPGTSLITPYVTPVPCTSGQGNRPAGSRSGSFCPNLASACISDPNDPESEKLCRQEAAQYVTSCANSYEEWLGDTTQNFWVTDPEITALGRGGERSRQFLLWALTRPSIDGHKNIRDAWSMSKNVALFFILIVVIIMGIGIIIGQRNNFSLGIDVAPLVIRLAVLLIYLFFSYALILFMVQLADVLMEFFIRNLGVRELFNIFFVDLDSGSVLDMSEAAYRQFIGCTNWNSENLEMVRTSKFLIKFTNMTYYFIGIMLILRKIVLWFLLVVSPFLVILAPWVFIRNIGWIWIGVFFQWIFYGPLFALFLGTLATIWNSSTHIPFVFDFSRTHKMSEAVYPTSINILYGGPAQTLGIWNTANYVDTFVEYVISLIMLWTVLILPWWLLRVFRDYCCDGIYAMKNIMLSMYDTMRSGGPGGPSPTPTTPKPTGTTGIEMKLPKKIEVPVEAKIKIETIQDIKAARTDSIVQSMNMRATSLKDIARLETNKAERENVTRNLNMMRNPMQANTPTERQKLMNLRNEIQSRALKGDVTAKNLSAVTSTSNAQQQVSKQHLIDTMPKMIPVIATISVKYNVPKEKAQNIISKVINQVTYDQSIINNISTQTNVSEQKTRQILQTVSRTDVLDRPAAEIISQTIKATGLQEGQVKSVLTQTAEEVKTKRDISEKVAVEEDVKQETVEKMVQEHLPSVYEPEKHVEDHVPQSKKVTIEDYEDVKKMWIQQYEKGEVPVSENITDRNQWVDTDTVEITNIMNKIMSTDKNMQEQGLEAVGYILPVFMVNNLSGEELLVYLKAKLEAAKQVKKDLEKEEEIREKVKSEEEFVEIEAPKKKEEAKAEILKRELKEDEVGGAESEEGGGGGEGWGEKTESDDVEGTAIKERKSDKNENTNAQYEEEEKNIKGLLNESSDDSQQATQQATQQGTQQGAPQPEDNNIGEANTSYQENQTSPQNENQIDEIKKKLEETVS